MDFKKDIKTENIKKSKYVAHLAAKKYIFQPNTKGYDLVPLLCISSEAAQHNLVLGYNLTFTVG